MSSKPPPFSPAQPPTVTTLVNWSAVVASVAVSFALLVSVVAWIVTHPHKAAAHAAPPALAILTSAAEDAPPPPPAVRPAPALEVVPAFHHPDRPEVLLNHVPLIEEAPPLLPPPPEKEPVKERKVAAKAPPAAPAGETYGTQVLFLNNPQVAAEMARNEKKLLFVMHISGNFEDSCFT